MRGLLVATVLAAVAVATVGPWGAERARACRILPPHLPSLAEEAELVVVGTLREATEQVAVLEVARSYKGTVGSAELAIDNRAFDLGGACERVYVDGQRYAPGSVVAFLDPAPAGSGAEYEVAWFGLGLIYVEGGRVEFQELGERGFIAYANTTLGEFEEKLRALVGAAATPVPTATETPTAAATATSAGDTPAPPVSGDIGSGESGGLAWAVIWVAVGVVVGAAGVGGVWWFRARRSGAGG